MEYTNSQVEEFIDEYIHNERHRRVLKLRLIDGLTYGELAEHCDISERQAKRIVYKTMDLLSKHIK